MSILDAKQYARTHMDALGYNEWQDGFNDENIPSTLLDGSYHVEVDSVTGAPHDQSCMELSVEFSVSLFRKGYRDPAQMLDAALTESEAIIIRFMKSTNRLAPTTVHNVNFGTLGIDPLDTNDNSAIIRLEFNALVIIDTK